jgi:hypothetical protein
MLVLKFIDLQKHASHGKAKCVHLRVIIGEHYVNADNQHAKNEINGIFEIQNLKLYTNNNKNDTCHVQSLKKDIYLCALDSFDHVFTQPKIIFCNSPKAKFDNLIKFSTLIH